MNTARFRAYIYLLIVVLIWGAAPSIIKYALTELPPFLFLFYRFLITVIFLTPFYLSAKSKGINAKTLPTVLISSLLASTVTLGLLFYGTNLTTSLDSSLISATSPIVIILTGALLLKERITKREKIGIAVTFIGTLIVAVQSLFETGVDAERSILGNSLILLSNFTFAAALYFSKKDLRRGVSAFSLMYIMFLVGLFSVIPFTLKEAGGKVSWDMISSLSVGAHLSVIYMAFLSGALAYLLYQKAQKTIETSEAAVFLYLQPLVTAPFGLIWLKEHITPPFLLGAIVIAIGVVLAEFKGTKNKSHR